MGSLTRVKTWVSEVLFAADLNAEFDNLINNGISLVFPADATLDFNGQKLILDSDADSSIQVTVDDRLDMALKAVTLFRFDGTAVGVQDGLDFTAGAAGTVSIDAVGVSGAISINLVPKGTGTVQVGGESIADRRTNGLAVQVFGRA